jgi:hypothetical protein
MSSGPGTPTVDQLRVFLSVVDSGSFAGRGAKARSGDMVGRMAPRN